MKKIFFRSIAILLIMAGIAGCGYLWNVKQGLEEQIGTLETDLDLSQRKTRAAIKKYNQEKAKVATCMRSKMVVEAQKAKLQRVAKNLENEKTALVGQVKGLEQRLVQHKSICEQRVDKLKEAYKQLADSRKEIIAKYKELAEKNRGLSGQIVQLESQKAELSSELSQTESRLTRSLKHNEKLCVIAEELTNKYREKTNGSEPFTKIEMVELEHIIQDYLKRIDKEKIIEQ
nr:hypothetical protein [uncultured Desulfobacter sp.]